MWEDLKKLGSLLLDQTKEQKDILLLNLKIKSFNSRLDTEFSRLGKHAYSLLKTGGSVTASGEEADEKLKNLIGVIKEVEEEVDKTGKQIEALISEAEAGRDEMSKEVEAAWKKTKSAVESLKSSFSAEGEDSAGLEDLKANIGKKEEKKADSAKEDTIVDLEVEEKKPEEPEKPEPAKADADSKKAKTSAPKKKKE